ncbi:MAG TPA: hypothetical protein VG318_09120 [Actinomycetota bacterium]|nr:hypothetical protein [Actinomycetota bacterium]
MLLVPCLCALATPATAAPQCPLDASNVVKPNKLYLYFPTASDASFHPFTTDYPVSPAEPFVTADLPSYTGTLAALVERITDVVVDDYCEFNVHVTSTTTAPPTTSPRRVTVAIGSDADPGAEIYGIADDVDTGDLDDVNYARVFAGTYQAIAGGVGEALNGANSTVKRWGNSIGGTAAHEAGHTYGLSHSDGEALGSGEDALTRHIMPVGTLISDDQRAAYRRHFNDKNFGVLASNVGLSVQTIHNWDYVNPNSSSAKGIRIDVLSTSPTLTNTWSYLGSLSPWGAPVVSANGTASFNGTPNYNKFRVTWTAPQAWDNGSPGIVPPATKFHVGAAFNGVDYNVTDPVIITGVKLLNSAGNPLPLSPRMFGYDAGTLDAVNGNFGVRLFNTSPGAGALRVANVTVSELPRVASIDSMVSGVALRSWDGGRIRPWSVERPFEPRKADCGRDPSANDPRDPCEKVVKDSIRLPVAKLADGRHIFEENVRGDCEAPNDNASGVEVNECVSPGFDVDLFPATTFLVTATVIDPHARHWSPARKRFVVGPLRSKLFYQVAGIHPDLNHNGEDDAIDIASGRSSDEDRNGVPDDAGRPVTKQLL